MTNKPTQSLREEISKILVKNHMSTRQVAINEILSLFSQEQKRLLKLVNEKVIGGDLDADYTKDWRVDRDLKEANRRKRIQREALNKLEREVSK